VAVAADHLVLDDERVEHRFLDRSNDRRVEVVHPAPVTKEIVPNSSAATGPIGNALASPGTSAVENARKMSPEK
jgi:hypothetical protein